MNSENDAVRDKAKKSTKIPVLFDNFEKGKEIAEKMIPNYHPHLATAKIGYICRNQASKKAGNPVSGAVYKMQGKFGFLTGFDLVMEVALDVWNELSPSQRYALIDHLLTRISGEEDEETGEYRWKLIPPDIQEFTEVAERHGQWNEGLVEMEKALRHKM